MPMIDRLSSSRRKRGVVLSSHGWQRLQAAEHLSALRENLGRPYTLEQLSDRTGLSNNTLTKVRHRQKPVDYPTLEAYFQAFGLAIATDDYLSQDNDRSASVLTHLQQTPLKGQLELDSPFYIYRPPAEKLCNDEVFTPGALIRIKAPRQFGKTSLMARILSHAEDRGLRTAAISLQLADNRIFTDLDQFLRWFCAMVARALGLPTELEERWDSLFGGSYSCSDYFETYLLPADPSPLLLVLDEVNVVFNYPHIAADFFGMLRAWYEQGKHGGVNRELWQRLRLVIVHSTEAYLPLNLHQSPFNVGLSIELSCFNLDRVKELTLRYGLSSENAYAETLLNLVGGHPYLTQLALFDLSQRPVEPKEFTQTAIAPDSIFSSHLRQQLACLEQDPELLNAMKQTLLTPEGALLHPTQAFKLQGLGLVSFQNQRALPSCNLYRAYFSQVLK
ncbi:AAA-like domain-containing protein [Desertifilum sp. FACHB-1129]|nr:AAA-like domain-containing protein [Desertifilum sp. FACHB-1129]MBD2321038.1 AAA-like domain-containing protein [Desertifilum sp. FACHB-866]MBD2331167.1 AAA-like domain-containing protein [Desertifilum sp. FACHB-868]